MLASGAVIGLENARLYQEEQARRYEAEQRRQVAESLRDILTVLNSNSPEEIFCYIVASRPVVRNQCGSYLPPAKQRRRAVKVQARRATGRIHCRYGNSGRRGL
jgi:hypothetical protein